MAKVNRSASGAALTDKLRDLFEERLKDDIFAGNDKTLLEHILKPPGSDNSFKLPKLDNGKLDPVAVMARIKHLNDTLYDGKAPTGKINWHHLHPVWAGGKDIPENVWPAPVGHQDHKTGVHGWWSKKLEKSFSKALKTPHKNFLLCNKRKVKGKLQPYAIRTFSEGNVTDIAKRFDEAGKTITIEMTCKEYCRNLKKK